MRSNWMMGAVVMTGLIASGGSGAQAPAGSSLAARARTLHFSSIVLDTHADTPQRFYFEHFDLGNPDGRGQVDLPRMREGGLNAEFFSIWCPTSLSGQAATDRALALIAAVKQQVQAHPRDLVLATTAAQVRAAHQNGKIAILMGVEGGHMINDNLAVLRQFAGLGVRYMTLTHTADTDWAGSSGDDAKHGGLTPFGREVIHEMNRLGVLVDISHVSDQTFADALATSSAPLIASHSSCRALCDAPRNLSDDMIRALAAKGGVIQINYHAGFLSQAYRNAVNQSAEYKQRVAAMEKADGDNEAAQIRDEEAIAHSMMEAGTLPKVEWQAILDHIDHAVKVGGVDHVGLGSDFDGSVMPLGMDASALPKITEGLLQRGYSEGDVRKILGENMLRVMEAAEDAAKAR